MKKVFSILFLISLASCSTSKKQKLDQEFKNRKGQAPFLNQPEVRTIWVPDKMPFPLTGKGFFIEHFPLFCSLVHSHNHYNLYIRKIYETDNYCLVVRVDGIILFKTR